VWVVEGKSTASVVAIEGFMVSGCNQLGVGESWNTWKVR
jgi:hypothetical protein